MYIVDTDVSVDYMKGEKYAVALLSSLENMYLTSMTMAELFYGVYNSEKKDKLLSSLGDFMQKFGSLKMEFWDCVNFGKIKAHLRKKGAMVGDADIINAATAVSYDFTIITRNMKHYESVPGLKILKAGPSAKL